MFNIDLSNFYFLFQICKTNITTGRDPSVAKNYAQTASNTFIIVLIATHLEANNVVNDLGYAMSVDKSNALDKIIPQLSLK